MTKLWRKRINFTDSGNTESGNLNQGLYYTKDECGIPSKPGQSTMSICYNRLWKLLIDRGMKKKDLQKVACTSSASVTKLAKNRNVNTDILQKICIALKCDICDIVEMMEENNFSREGEL